MRGVWKNILNGTKFFITVLVGPSRRDRKNPAMATEGDKGLALSHIKVHKSSPVKKIT